MRMKCLVGFWVMLVCACVGFTIATEVDSDRAVLSERSQRPADQAGRRPKALDAHPGISLFTMDGADNAACVRSLPDVTGDGLDEVLVGIDESGTDNLFCLDGASTLTASVVWSLQTSDGASGGAPWGDQAITTISDHDGNQAANLLLGTAWGGRTAYNIDGLDGTILWRFDTYLEPDSGWVYSLAELNDINGDGVPESAFGAGSNNDSLYMVDSATTDGSQATVIWRYSATDAISSVRSLGDVNGDGDHDVLAAVTDSGEQVLCLDGGTSNPTGHVLWSTPLDVFAVEVMPDITGDGINEALAVLWVMGGSAVRCLNGATGVQVWASTSVMDYGYMVSLLEDITGDDVPEIIVGSFENAVSVLDGSDGSQVWQTVVGTDNGGDVWTARAIGDLDGDGGQEVIAGSFDTFVYAMDGDDGSIFWAHETKNRVFSVSALGDLTGDGRPEVVAGTQDTINNTVVHVLDGAAGIVLFEDGFESGETDAWTAVVP